jgi:hypothetical protein
VRQGSKVICVDDRFPTDLLLHYNSLPIKDKVYVVRGMGVGISLDGQQGEVVVYLEGLQNPCSSVPPHPERGFAQHRFRELEPPAEDTQEAECPWEDLATA